jgi:integrase
MPTVNFYLKKPAPTKNTDSKKSLARLVYLQMRYQGEKFVYSCGFSVEPKNWDAKKQQVKTRSATDASGQIHYNSKLTKLHDGCLKAYNVAKAAGTLNNETLKKYVRRFMNDGRDPSEKNTTFFDVVDMFIRGEDTDTDETKSPATITTYKTSKKHLQSFEKHEKFRIDFDTINAEFALKYRRFLSSARTIDGKKHQPLSPNSLAKELKNVRTFMNFAVQMGYTSNTAHKGEKFKRKTVKTDAVTLYEDELRRLYAHDFSSNKRLEAVRDLFVFSSFVGLRYSDASNIKPENIVTLDDGKEYIKIVPRKTKDSVTIPVNDVVLDIFRKYAHNTNRLPTAITNQKFNQYLKELAKEAGFTETGRLSSDLSKPLYECLSSHTARRNFATNSHRSGMDTRMIMAVTGHRTEKSFEAYLKVTNDENAKRMRAHMERNLSQKHLKAI